MNNNAKAEITELVNKIMSRDVTLVVEGGSIISKRVRSFNTCINDNALSIIHELAKDFLIKPTYSDAESLIHKIRLDLFHILLDNYVTPIDYHDDSYVCIKIKLIAMIKPDNFINRILFKRKRLYFLASDVIDVEINNNIK